MTTPITELVQILRKAATQALWTGEWNDVGCNTVECTYPEGSNCAGENDEICHPVPLGVTAHIAAAQPKNIIALIDALEEQAARITTLEQTLREIANADTAEWDDRSEFEGWAKGRARGALGERG